MGAESNSFPPTKLTSIASKESHCRTSIKRLSETLEYVEVRKQCSCAGTPMGFVAPMPLAVPVFRHRPKQQQRMDVRPPRRRRAYTTTPHAFDDSTSHERTLANADGKRSEAPLPWVETALLTLFEPAPERKQPITPASLTPKWLAIWQSLTAIYGLRFRLNTREQFDTLPRPDDPDVVLVETPRFQDATGFDPARGVSQVVVCISDLLADAVVIEMVRRVNHPMDVALIIAGVAAAYASADLVSALYNWLRLNFSPNASIFGEQDASRALSFSRLVAPHCAIAIPCFAFMLATPPGELAGDAFVCYFLTFLSLLPAFGEWSAGDTRTPRVIALLQRAGVIVCRSTEDAYHRLEYGVVCGIWDSFLKRLKIFSALERWIYINSGGRIRPKVWEITGAPSYARLPDDIRDYVPGFTVEERPNPDIGQYQNDV